MRCLSLLCFILLFATACGKKGALIYPDMLVPAAPASVTARQVGSSIRLTFTIPGKDRAGQALTDVSGINILRRETITGQDSACSSCVNDFRAFKLIYVDHVNPDTQRYGSLVMFLDHDVREGREYAYKVLAFTKGNVDGEASIPVVAAMVKAPQAPALRAFPAPTEIKFEFAVQSPLEGVLAGYNLYRTVKGEPLPFLALNKEPLTANSFIDTGLEPGVTYIYAARTVVSLPNGALVESTLSKEVEAGLSEDE